MIGYIIITAVGMFFLLTSFIFGEIHDFFSGLFDHDISIGDHHILEAGSAEAHMPSFMSSRSFFAFVVGFGAVGILCTSLGMNAFLAILPSIGSGLVMATIAWGATAMLYRQQATSGYITHELIGKTATVNVPIPNDGLGEIYVIIGSSGEKKMARSTTGKEINGGANVRITNFIGDIAIVEKV